VPSEEAKITFRSSAVMGRAAAPLAGMLVTDIGVSSVAFRSAPGHRLRSRRHVFRDDEAATCRMVREWLPWFDVLDFDFLEFPSRCSAP
jgi:hypothetical protein